MRMPRSESLWARVVTPISRCSPSIQDAAPALPLHRAPDNRVVPARRTRVAAGPQTGGQRKKNPVMHIPLRALAIVAVALLASFTAFSSGPSAGASTVPDPPQWEWPLDGPRAVVDAYRAPAHAYGAGHRGVDLGSSTGARVLAPADGTVAFRGTVVDRPLLTIEHANGLVTTFEPVRSALAPGDVVSAGQEIGVVDVGGHAPPSALHLGVRLEGDYINPMLLFGEVPRAILLPCCARL